MPTALAPSLQNSNAQKKLGLYIHFPFCAYKCGYCDFNSWIETQVDPQRQWLSGIQNEILFWKQQGLASFHVDTLFMGGGTPSLLDEGIWFELVDFIKKNIIFDSKLEWTVECNPETITPRLLENFHKSGVNRLSLGIQSFKDKFLKRLERGASFEKNRESLRLISETWPGRWSFDLMFGLPEQNINEWREDLLEALSFNPKHISAYQLTLTTEKSKRWLQPIEEDLLEAYRETRNVLGSAGLLPYEVSNFSVEGEESRHNLKYWRAEAFLGLGPGAYALIPNELLDSVSIDKLYPHKSFFGAHLKNPSRFEEWLNSTNNPLGLKTLEFRDSKIHATELLLVGLRLEKGIERSFFPKDVDLSKLQKLSDCITLTDTHVLATPRGREILDTTILHASEILF